MMIMEVYGDGCDCHCVSFLFFIFCFGFFLWKIQPPFMSVMIKLI
jgi:hypothetical protein